MNQAVRKSRSHTHISTKRYTLMKPQNERALQRLRAIFKIAFIVGFHLTLRSRGEEPHYSGSYLVLGTPLILHGPLSWLGKPGLQCLTTTGSTVGAIIQIDKITTIIIILLVVTRLPIIIIMIKDFRLLGVCRLDSHSASTKDASHKATPGDGDP